MLPSVEQAVDEGRSVPIQVQRAGGSHQMVIIGHRDHQLEIYDPSSGISWISEDDFINGNLGNVGTAAQHVYGVVMPPSEESIVTSSPGADSDVMEH
jgi:hypothetical protein